MKLSTQISKLLKQDTGTHFLDSGGDNGRMWQRNATKVFEAEKQVTLEDGYFTVSLYHYLKEALKENDEVTKTVNKHIKQQNAYWCGEFDFETLPFECDEIGDQFNTYNWSAPFSQDFTGIQFKVNGESYILLQIHNGADIRGGYTDVKCFKCIEHIGHVDVIGEINGVSVDTFYNGHALTTEDGETYEYNGESEYELSFYLPE